MKDLRRYIAKKVIVSGDRFDIGGTLEKVGGDSIELVYAEFHADTLDGSDGTRKMDGVVVIPFRAIDYVQVV